MSFVTFSPKPELLQSIQATNSNPLVLVFNSFNPEEETKEQCELVIFTIACLRGGFEEKYRERYTGGHSQYTLVDMFNEQVKNCMEHGNKSDPSKQVAVGIWLGELGILFAYRQECDYFSHPETKRLFESRTMIPSTRVSAPRGHGTQGLFEVAEEIFVDTEENTLYATYLIQGDLT